MRNARELRFRRGTFVAVLHSKGWWLAQLYTHAYDDSDKVRIRWFDEKKSCSDKINKEFLKDEVNDIPSSSIICKVKRAIHFGRDPFVVAVPTSECKEIEVLIKEGKNAKTDVKPKPKKIINKSKPKKVIDKSKKTVKPLPKDRKRKAQQKPSGPAKKSKVMCYPSIKIYETNPFWDPKVALPRVAASVDSFGLARAVLHKQHKEAEKLFKDKSLSSLGHCLRGNKGNLVTKSTWHHAIDNRDKKMIELLVKLSNKEIGESGDKTKARAKPTQSLIDMVETGTYNPASLGIDIIRPLTVGRGCREGSGAFEELKAGNLIIPSKNSAIFKYAVKSGCSYDFVKYLKEVTKDDDFMTELFDLAVCSNNRDVAAGIVKESLGSGQTDQFNNLHQEVLAFNKGEKLSPFKSVNCHKRTGGQGQGRFAGLAGSWRSRQSRQRVAAPDTGKVTPLHSAALNPNPAYIKQMLSQDPEPEIVDERGFTPLHYAATNKSNEVTKYLLGLNINVKLVSKNGVTPLMRAARAGSVVNIKTLIGYAYNEHFSNNPKKTPGPIIPSRVVDIELIKSVIKESKKFKSFVVATDDQEGDKDGDDDSDMLLKQLQKLGIGGMELAVLKGNFQSYTALTMAVESGHYEAVSVLLDLGADPNKALGAAKRKMFPIHIAAKYGHLEILKCLILHGAKTRAKDRHGLTAFHYACKFNQLHCVSWLAGNVVPDANIGDSSGNTPLQYACANGWILVVKYLIEELHVDITIKNSWGMQALEVAVLRQQTGVVDFLLSQGGVDINFRDSSGATLIMKLCQQNMVQENAHIELLEYLLKKPGIDVKAVDNNGCNALHYLAIQQKGAFSIHQRIIPSLLRFGLDINSETNNGKTPLSIAILSKRGGTNIELVKALIEHGSSIVSLRLANNRNILQHFINQPGLKSLELIETIEKLLFPKKLREQVTHIDDEGYNVLHLACIQYYEKARPERYQNTDKQDCARKVLTKLLSGKFPCDINSEVAERKIDHDKVKCSCKEHGTKGYHAYSCPVYPYPKYGKYRALNFAMQYGTTDEVRQILSYSPDLNYVDVTGNYPLHYAVKGIKGIGCKTHLIPLLIEAGAVPDILPEPGYCKDNSIYNVPILVLAASHYGGVELLLKAGACVQATAPDGRNVLHHIVSHWHSEKLDTYIKLAEMVVPQVESINEVDNDGNSYLHHAVSGVQRGSNVSIEMISMLLLKGADPNLANSKNQTPLHFAFMTMSKQQHPDTDFSDPIEVVSILTQVMTKEAITAADNFSGFTALHLSAMQGGSVTSTHLIGHGCKIDAVDNQGNTPLNLAMHGKHQSCVLMLLEKGANTHKPICNPIYSYKIYEKKSVQEEETEEEDPYKWLVLDEKPIHEDPDTFPRDRILYRVIIHGWQGVLFNLVDHIESPYIPVEAAINLQKYNLAITLLLKFGKATNPSDRNEDGQTLVHRLALTPNKQTGLQIRLLKMLIKFKFNLTTEDTKYRCTPLHYCCLVKKYDLAQWFTGSMFVINAKDVFGRTPICALFWNNKPKPPEEFIRFLVKSGASLEATCDFNIQESNLPLFDYTFNTRRTHYFTSFSDRFTVLIKTIIENKKAQFTLLLELGASVNTPCSKGMTPLMYAAKLNRVDMFERLLQSATADSLLCKSDEGMTVLHYYVSALTKASYGPPVILKTLAAFLKKNKIGQNLLEVKDNNGKTIAEHCSSYPRYLKILKLPAHSKDMDLEIADSSMTNQPPDFTKDCETFFTLSATKDRMGDPVLAEPDSELSLTKEECEVYKDGNGVYYDMLMTKIDLKRQWEQYNFYKLQIVRNIGKDIYILLTRWGRIGDEGQHQETPFPTLDECKAEFMKVFKAKTKNDWNDLANFQPSPGKYKLVSREWRYHNQYKSVDYDFRIDDRPDCMDKDVFEVLLQGSDPKSMARHLKDDFKLEISQLPFGFVKLEMIDEAQKILNKILELYTAKDKKTPTHQADYSNQTYDLSNQLYQLIPQQGFSVTKVHAIRHEHQHQEWQTRLVNLRDMEIINRIMAASQLNKATIHPVKYIYDSIGCEITKLPRSDVMSQYILRNIYAAGESYNNSITGIYKLTPSGLDERPKGDRRLLYHGIATGALLSILKRGIQNAPFGRSYGTRFGEGIYLADNFQKSLSYATGHKSKFIVLASVAMGKVYEAIMHDNEGMNDDGVDTVWAVGKLQQDPTHNVILESGDLFGMGRFKKVFKESFVCLKKTDSTANNNMGVGLFASFANNRTHFKVKDFVFEPKPGTNEVSKNKTKKYESDDSMDSSGESEDEDPSEESEEEDVSNSEEVSVNQLTDLNEFVVKNAENIRLEYLIQIG